MTGASLGESPNAFIDRAVTEDYGAGYSGHLGGRGVRTYTIIGGVNGVGKSSFTGVLKERCTDLGIIIDVDKITTVMKRSSTTTTTASSWWRSIGTENCGRWGALFPDG